MSTQNNAPNREGTEVLEPVKRYTRIVDRLECPICGKRLGERFWDYATHGYTQVAYTDTGPTYLRNRLIGPKIRTFKPCGCESVAVLGAVVQ